MLSRARKRLILLALLLLAAFMINTIAGFWCYRLQHFLTRIGPTSVHDESLRGPAAAARGWPARPPATWPAPTELDNIWGRCYWYSIAREASPGNQARFSMLVIRYGWPMPVFEQAQFWWPWNNPKLKTTVPDESGLRIYWPGFLLVPPAVAIPIWLLLPVPNLILARYRRRRNRCPQCGYPSGPFAACPECGRPAKPQPVAT